MKTPSMIGRRLLALAAVLAACDGTAPNTKVALPDLAGAWIGTASQSGGPWHEIFEYRLALAQTEDQISGSSMSRWLAEPRYFADFQITGTLGDDGSVLITEHHILDESRPPSGTWCFKTGVLSYSTEGGGRLTGAWSAPGCLPGVINLQRRPGTATSSSLVTWPTAPGISGDGYDGPCDDWPGDPRGCFLLPGGIWRDVQPFLRHYSTDYRGYHLGADWNFGSGADDKNKPVHAIADGVVSGVVANASGWGNVIFLRHQLPIGTLTSMYAHVNWSPAGPPALHSTVVKGQEIARIGNGNNLYPYHLHLEVRGGDNTVVGSGYSGVQVAKPPQGQIDPNIFTSTYR